ncbi:uncharacterized protein LOC129966487 [Argiope bruennichi]|uniref:uncharacterized protein LOC129966487 n=1 Tax=Argiope bruennichi TaxID=94029 RepID=UPI0024945ED5|nr:uncharacterized protein LOC129966487 [Argiope bruennichi]
MKNSICKMVELKPFEPEGQDETSTTSTTTTTLATTTTTEMTTSTTEDPTTTTTTTTSSPTSTTDTTTTTTSTTEEPTTEALTTTTTEATTTTTTTTTTTEPTTTSTKQTTSTTEGEESSTTSTLIPSTTTTTTTTTTTEAPTTTTTEEPITTEKIETTTTTTTEIPTTTTTESTTTTSEASTTTTATPTTTTTELSTTTTTTDSPTTMTATTTTTISTTETPTTTTESTTTTTTEKPTTTTEKMTTITTTESATTTTTEKPITTTERMTTTTEESTTTTTTTKVPTAATTTTTAIPTITTTTEALITTTTEKPTTTTTTDASTTTTTAEPTTTTTTTAPTTTMLPTTLRPPRTGKFYNETGDYFYPNMVKNGSAVDEVKVTNGPIGFGRAIRLDGNRNGSSKQCLRMHVIPKSDPDAACFDNPEKCDSGISFSIWSKIVFFRNDDVDRYIFSTGASAEGKPGVALYFRGIYFFAVVSTGKEMWTLTVPGPVNNNTWREIGLRWTKDRGLDLFVNSVMIGQVRYPDDVEPSFSRDGAMMLTVGCLQTSDGEFENFAYGEYDELTIWMWALNGSEIAFFLGGHDPNTTCDVETHPLRCETNTEKILENMDNLVVENTEGLINALNHLKSLSEVENDPKGSEDDEGDDRNDEELRLLISIVEKLIVLTWDKPDELSLSDLEELMVVQDLASNLLEEKYIDGWQKIQNEGKSSVDFLNLVVDYQVQKMKQTDNGKEPLLFTRDSTNINSDIRKRMLYDVHQADEPIFFPDLKEEESQRRRRSAKDNEEEKKDEGKVRVQMTKNVYGEMDKRTKVIFAGNAYKNLEKLAPLWNAKTGNATSLVFIDSEVVSVTCNPNASSSALEREPLTLILKHRRKVRATGRKLLADEDMEKNGEIRRRECMRWDPTLEIKKSKAKGGWSTDGCSVANTSSEETTCQCTQLGTYAIMSKIRAPFAMQEEEEWVKWTKWACFGISIILLAFYILVILIRSSLHEQYHIIRLNMAAAALGGLVSFFLTDFLFEDEEVCRILSILIHFFYTATGMWLAAEAHALFCGLVLGSFKSKLTLHVMMAWVAPGCMIGGCFMLFYNYGYDYRCLVGPTAPFRWLLVSPILVASAMAFMFSLLTCINYGTPAVKKTAIVNELSSATRANFIVIVLFLLTWIFGIFALVDLGFDSDEIPAFNPIFQILNACLGIFIACLIGLGSKHFRYCLCHSDKNNTKTKAMNLDPFDIHDKAAVNNRKKIYAS